MEFSLEDGIHYDFDRSFYWARITTKDQEGNEGKALIGAGANYLADHFHVHSRADITDEHKNQWLEQAIERLRREMPGVRADMVYYQIDSFSPEGMQNGLHFLRTEVTP